MYCQNCGSENKDGAKFCRQCGSELLGVNVSGPSKGKGGYRKPKKNAKKIFVVLLTVILVLSSVGIISIISSSNKKDEMFYIYLNDKGLLLSSNNKKEPIVLDESIVDFYDLEGVGSLAYLFEDLPFCYVSDSNKLIYTANFSYDYQNGGAIYDTVAIDLNDIEAPKENVSDDSIWSKYVKDGKIYFESEGVIYSSDLKETNKIADNVQYWWMCVQNGRIVYETEYVSDDYFADLYAVIEGSTPKKVANYIKLIHHDNENDIYVYYDQYGQVYTYINGVVNEVDGLCFERDESIDWDIEFCGENGNIIYQKCTAHVEYGDGYETTKYTYSYYSYINGKIEEIADFGSVSDDGTVLCKFNKGEDYKSSTTLYKYELKNNEYVKTEEYTDVYEYEITKYNDLLILRNYRDKGDFSSFDLYLNKNFIDSDVCLDWWNNHHLFDIQVLSKDRLSYRTDMRYKHEEIETYTLNLYDGKKSEEIAFNVDDYHFWPDDNTLIYIEVTDWNTLKGDLKMYNGKKTILLSEGVYGVSSIYGNDY